MTLHVIWNKAALLRPNRLVRGSCDFVLLQGGFTKTQLSWKISDHYPLWAEISIRA